MHKNSLNNFICHLSWLKKLCPYSYTSPQTHSWIFETLPVIIFWIRVTCKMLNVTCIKIHSIILSVTCHGLRNFPLLMHIPSNPFVNFDSLWVIIFWVRVTRKMLNLNWKKIHSIILFVTCHGWRNFPLLIHIPLYPFVNFQNPMSYYFLSLSFDPPHPTPTWPTPPLHDPPQHTPPHPFMAHPIPPHPTPGTFLGTKEPFFMGCFTMSPSYELLFSELESLIKCWMWIGKKFTQ